ncbi:MAG: PhoH family protein [Chlamydiia bacterium]|nr:PhoH family protein [Chlamydiia bacterium]
MGRKTFVLDTNVLILDSEAILRFPNSDVVLPVTVIEELDNMKRLPNDTGKNARAAIRLLDSLRLTGEGSLHESVRVGDGASVRIQLDIKTDYNSNFALSVNDNKIIMAAYLLQERGHETVFVSKDLAARIKAEAIGLEAEDYLQFKLSYEQLYRGVRYVDVEKGVIDQYLQNNTIDLGGDPWQPNEFAVMRSPEQSSAEGKYDAASKRVCPLIKTDNIWGLNPRNTEQRFALDLLLRNDIKLVALVGPAGTGKTLLALAAGLKLAFDEGTFNKILISRPIVPMGRDIGYLPGTKEEKLYHWMQPIYDNLEHLCAGHGGDARETMDWVMQSKKIELEAVTYIRGRSLPAMYFIIDEAQNLTPHEVKTIISRAGEGTKVILAGDPTQIDNPYLDKDYNAITHVVNAFKGLPIFGSVFMTKTERSELAGHAIDIL